MIEDAAFPSPAVQMPNGAFKDGERRLRGMSYRQWLLGQVLQGAAGSLQGLGPLEIEEYVERCLGVVELAMEKLAQE